MYIIISLSKESINKTITGKLISLQYNYIQEINFEEIILGDEKSLKINQEDLSNNTIKNNYNLQVGSFIKLNSDKIYLIKNKDDNFYYLDEQISDVDLESNELTILSNTAIFKANIRDYGEYVLVIDDYSIVENRIVKKIDYFPNNEDIISNITSNIDNLITLKSDEIKENINNSKLELKTDINSFEENLYNTLNHFDGVLEHE